MSVSRDVFKLFSGKFISSGLGFVGLAFFSHRLGAAKLGTYFLFEACLRGLSIPADMGVKQATKKRLSERHSANSILSTAAGVKLVLFVLTALPVLFLQDYINRYIGAQWTLELFVALGLSEAANFVISVVQGELNVGKTAGPRTLRQVIRVSTGAVFILLGFGPISLVWAMILGLFVMLLAANYIRRTNFGYPSVADARALFDFSRYAVISFVSGFAYNWVDVMIIGFLVSNSAVAAYEVSWRVSIVALMLAESATTTAFPHVSQLHSEEDYREISRLLSKILVLALLLVVPLFFGSLVVGGAVLEVIFDVTLDGSVLVLQILLLEKVFRAVQLVLHSALNGIDRPELAARATIYGLTCNVILNVPLTYVFGIRGAAAATALSVLLSGAFHVFYIRAAVTTEVPWRIVGWIFGSGALMAVLVQAVDGFVQSHRVADLFILVTFGGIVYGGMLLANRQTRNRVEGVVSSWL